jgi:hypothetical protein
VEFSKEHVVLDAVLGDVDDIDGMKLRAIGRAFAVLRVSLQQAVAQVDERTEVPVPAWVRSALAGGSLGCGVGVIMVPS